MCVEDTPARRGRNQRYWMLNHHLANSSKAVRDLVLGAEDYEPCEEDYTTTYLNLPEVKDAMHVKSDKKWMECSYTINYNAADGMESMTPYYNYLIDGGFGLNILVYSGDDDAVCGTVGTQNWIWDLGYEVGKGGGGEVITLYV